MFYIIKQGVYIHAVFGPYRTRAGALREFQQAYDAAKKKGRGWDFDGHHDYLLVDSLPKMGGDMPAGERIPHESLKNT